MNIESRARTLVVLAVVAIMLLAISLYAYFSMREEDSSDDILQLDSLDIETGSYYPWIWVNSTDDSLTAMHSCGLDVNFINVSTGERAYTIGTGGHFHFTNGTWSLMQQLDLQYLSPGNYSIDLYANCTFYAFAEAPELPPKHGRIQGNISLPSERPLLPRVLGVKLDYDDEQGAWYYYVELRDPDMDGDTASVYVAGKSGSVFNAPWTNNTDKNLTWVLEGYFETTASFRYLGVMVKDKDGPHSEATFTWSD